MSQYARILGACFVAVLCTGCGQQTATQVPQTQEETRDARAGSIFGGGGGISLLDLGGSDEEEGGRIGVNSFLWRASLDTLSFMPIASADPFGGVILTDWYSPPETPQERFKVNLYILGRQLRSDGLRVSVFRQQRDDAGWSDAPTIDNTATQLEDTILTRARQLRIAQQQS